MITIQEVTRYLQNLPALPHMIQCHILKLWSRIPVYYDLLVTSVKWITMCYVVRTKEYIYGVQK